MSKPGRRAAGLALVAIGALALGHCGGGSGAGPTDPPVPPVTTPTPAPTPTAEPPISASCAKLPAGTRTRAAARRRPSTRTSWIARSGRCRREQPAIFEGDQVLSIGAYYVGLIKVLDRQGLCAATDGEELGVTDRASSNEQFDVLSSQSRARFGPVSYRTTCSPSAVPIPQGGLSPPPAGCPLPSSREIACGREPQGRYHGDVEAAVAQIQKDKPELFDFNDMAPGDGLAGREEHRRLPPGRSSTSWPRRATAPSDDGEEIAVKQRLEHLQRAVRHQLPGQVHPHRRRHLPLELLSGGILAGDSSGGSGGAQPPESSVQRSVRFVVRFSLSVVRSSVRSASVAPSPSCCSQSGIFEEGRTARAVVVFL